MVERVIPPTPTRPILDADGLQNQEFRAWTQLVTNRTLFFGTGSPETVIEAPENSIYLDKAGTTGNILWVKRDNDIAGDISQGWILV